MMMNKNAQTLLRNLKLNKNLFLKLKLNNFSETQKQEVKLNN
jgi:hypothetical protein